MSSQLDSGEADPFLRIIAILTAWHDYLLNAIEATCNDRVARTIASAGESFSTYFLEGEGADEATQAFQLFVQEHPPPNTSEEFVDAMGQAGRLAASARIPFTDVDFVLQGVDTEHDWARRMKVVSRSELIRSFPRWAGKRIKRKEARPRIARMRFDAASTKLQRRRRQLLVAFCVHLCDIRPRMSEQVLGGFQPVLLACQGAERVPQLIGMPVLYFGLNGRPTQARAYAFGVYCSAGSFLAFSIRRSAWLGCTFVLRFARISANLSSRIRRG